MKSEYAFEFHDIVKIFPTPEGGQVNAVDHLSININHGEFFSSLGPSGYGKITSLRLMAGFEWPNSGEVAIDGEKWGGDHLSCASPELGSPRAKIYFDNLDP